MRLFAVTFAAAGMVSAAVDFETQIRPVLEKECLACHSERSGAGGVRLHTREAALAGSAIVPGKPEASSVYRALELKPGQPKAMPPGRQLSPADRQLIRMWIAEGAPWPATSAAASKTATLDEAEVVKQLHGRIVQNSTEKSEAEMKPYTKEIARTGVSFHMVPIQGGTFRMGTPESEKGHAQDERPQRAVTVAPFWMGKYEVTWDEYRLFMFSQMAKEERGDDQALDAISRPTRPYVEMSFGMGISGYPAISMTQHAANKFAQWLSARTGQFYRLPTEAEWEYACRAGTNSAYSFGDDPTQLGDYAVFSQSAGSTYAKVGTKKPNPWGLYDMHGNVMEWTLDQYDPQGYGGLGGDNPWNKATQPYPHAVRGGSWLDGATQLRCGARVASDPSWKQQDPQLPKSIWYHTDAQGLGFRLVRPLQVPSVQQMYEYWNSGVQDEP
jgi:formylglycine-generating enzyme required for sulfatase activity